VFSVAASAGILIVLALSSLGMVLGRPGVSTLPDGVESKDAFLILEREFSGGLTTPVEVVVHGPLTADVRTSISGLEQAMTSSGAFGPAQVQYVEDRDLAVVTAPLTGDPRTEDAFAAVRTLRSELIPQAFADTPTEVLVGGETAAAVDLFKLVETYTPIVFGLVLGLSFLLLTAAFRSVVVPIKAIIMNLLSVGAAYGVIVVFFQQNVGPAWVKELSAGLGFQQVESVEAWVPLFLFCVLFGLSMDYHVFLLSRIKERFDQTRDNAASVAYGLRTTAGLITGAALIMVAVFGGFAAGRLVSMQQTGFGLAVAVLLDATIVRAVLVPASMKLLGDWNWYLPRWLNWLPQLTPERPQPSEVPEPRIDQRLALRALPEARVDGDVEAAGRRDDRVGVLVAGPGHRIDN
jgi:putative drug exporter of the RND superfamily